MKRSLDESSGGANTNGAPDAKRRKCPYLDTINPQMLDFDFEKVCSVSLSDQNVYACLVCGRYFQGRGRATHAFTHAVQSAHHVFINLRTDRIYCLPDNYEVVDHSLRAVKDALRPSFDRPLIARLDQNRILAQDAFGVSYLPGACARACMCICVNEAVEQTADETRDLHRLHWAQQPQKHRLR